MAAHASGGLRLGQQTRMLLPTRSERRLISCRAVSMHTSYTLAVRICAMRAALRVTTRAAPRKNMCGTTECMRAGARGAGVSVARGGKTG